MGCCNFRSQIHYTKEGERFPPHTSTRNASFHSGRTTLRALPPLVPITVTMGGIYSDRVSLGGPPQNSGWAQSHLNHVAATLWEKGTDGCWGVSRQQFPEKMKNDDDGKQRGFFVRLHSKPPVNSPSHSMRKTLLFILTCNIISATASAERQAWRMFECFTSPGFWWKLYR